MIQQQACPTHETNAHGGLGDIIRRSAQPRLASGGGLYLDGVPMLSSRAKGEFRPGGHTRLALQLFHGPNRLLFCTMSSVVLGVNYSLSKGFPSPQKTIYNASVISSVQLTVHS